MAQDIPRCKDSFLPVQINLSHTSYNLMPIYIYIYIYDLYTCIWFVNKLFEGIFILKLVVSVDIYIYIYLYA